MSAVHSILESISSAWRPRERVPCSQFVERHIRLSDKVEGNSGPYDLANNPYWREILDAVHDPAVSSIAVLKSTQVGGSLASIVSALATSVIDPAPAMFVVPTADEGKTLRDRLYGNAESSDPVLAKKVPPVRLRNLLAIDLETMHIYLAWPRSKQRMRGKPCKYVWLSEIDVYQFDADAGDPNQAAERRTDRFPESTIVRESTPVGDDSPIAGYFESGDMRRLHCCCPHCGHWQELRFFVDKGGPYKGCGGLAGYHDSQGNLLDEEAARKSAHYLCQKGCRIDNTHKGALVRSGIWVPEGCHVDKRGRLAGTPLRSPRHRSYHLWQIHNPLKSFADIVATYLHHVADGSMREFIQDVLGQRFRSAKKLPSWLILGKRLAWSNPRGVVPREAWFLTAGADVQQDRVYWVVRGWGPQRTSWLVDWSEFMRLEIGDGDELVIATASDLLQLDGVLERLWPVADGKQNPLGRTELPVRLLNLDSNFRTSDVHEYCLPRASWKRLRAVRGDHHVSHRDRYRLTKVGRDPVTGERVEDSTRQLDVWGVQVDFYKQLLVDRFTGTPATGWPVTVSPAVHPGGFYLTSDILEKGEKHLKQLLNEPPTVITDPATGRKRTRFAPRTDKIGVDYWDATVYSEAAADMVVGTMGWSAQAWQRQLRDRTATATRRGSPDPAAKRNRNLLDR